ncbi:MAG: TIR domain-containing protein [Candidatus Pacebacteria bacterium]|nr:TIR domain-containing protein [Candidatus Paceibacterota bacterium]
MIKKKVFISFDFDNDEFLRNSLVGQSKNPDSPFEIEDWSVKEPWDERTWKEKCLTKIKKTDLVIVMVGTKTSQCSGVKAEIEMAKEAGVPVVGVRGYKDKICPSPNGLEGYYSWTWDNIKALVNGDR